MLLDNDRKVAVRRDAPELIEPEEESDDDEDDRTRLYEDGSACRARDNAANYEGASSRARSASWRRKPASAGRAQGATARAAARLCHVRRLKTLRLRRVRFECALRRGLSKARLRGALRRL